MAPDMAQRWFSRKEIAGGGVMLDTAIHSIDLFRFLVGEVSFVQGLMRHTNHAISEVEDTAVALLATADCRMGVIEASWSLEGGYNVVEVYGTQGVAIVHYWDGMPSRYRSRTHKEWQPIDETGPDRFLSEIRHFVDACLGRARLQVTGQDGLRAVEIVYETYHAAGWH
jgi:predicted dehydrogenase